MKYECRICGKKYTKFSRWIFKHYQKKHSTELVIKLKRI